MKARKSRAEIRPTPRPERSGRSKRSLVGAHIAVGRKAPHAGRLFPRDPGGKLLVIRSSGVCLRESGGPIRALAVAWFSARTSDVIWGQTHGQGGVCSNECSSR